MGVVLFLGGCVLTSWFSLAAILMTMTGNAHRWWDTIPLMGFGSALGITFPLIAAGVITLLVALVSSVFR
jgi:hypothetical protein